MKLPSARQLRYFLAVADHLSFSRAAEACHTTQSTLSNGLAELESILGARLFSRDTRTVALTREGESLIVPARDLLRQMENLVHMTGKHRAPLSGRLVLGTIPTIAPYLLPAFLPCLKSEFPDLDLSLKEDLSARQLDALTRGIVDVVLMAFPYDLPANISAEILWAEPFYLAHAATKNEPPSSVTIDSLAERNILLLEDGHCLRDHIVAACRLPSKKTDTASLGATSLQTLLQMVRHGFGETLLPEMATGSAYLPEGVTVSPFAAPPPYREIGLAWRRNDPREDEFRLLGKFIATPNVEKKSQGR